MYRLIPVLLLLSCTTNSDGWKQKRVPLADVCQGTPYHEKIEPPPARWEAYHDSHEGREQVTLTQDSLGLLLPCKGTKNGEYVIYYQ